MSKTAYTVNELAHELGIGRSKLYREMAEGKLVAHKIGKKTIFLSESVRAYLETLPKAAAA